MSIKVGFIGCGWVSSVHIPNLMSNPDVELIALCDTDKERSQGYGRKLRVNYYHDYREMIKKEEIDAMYIAVPPFAHGEIEYLCSQKGIHMFIEKPLALDMDTAKKIYGYIKKSKVINCVGYHWRYLPTVNKAKELLRDKKIGMIQAMWWLSYFPTPWWRIKTQSGGIIIENVTHCFDLLRYILGEIERVYCESDFRLLRDIKDFQQEDVYVTSIRFKNGVIGGVSNTCGDRHSPCQQSFKIFTDKMSLILQEHTLDIWQDNKFTRIKEVQLQNNLLGLYEKEDKVFIDAVKTENTGHIKSDYKDAMKTLELTLAVEESARRGIPILIR